jgi:hypothetical protein
MKLVVIALAALVPSTAAAEGYRCGSTLGPWNAPNGAAVAMRTEGIVARTFDRANRYYTHVMLSHGSQYMSHVHRADPSRNDDATAVFGRPLHTEVKTNPVSGNQTNTVGAGQPGASRLNMAATYVSMYGTRPTQVRVYPGNAAAANVANYVWGLPRQPVKSSVGLGIPGAERLLLPRKYWWTYGQEIFNTVEYSFVQFTHIGTNHRGEVSVDGLACSPFLAWAANRANGTIVPTEWFDEGVTMSALMAAHMAVTSKCTGDGNPGFVCEKAANQIVDCMAGTNNGACDNFGTEWQNPNNWISGRWSETLSTDRLVGYGAGDFPGNPSPWGQQAGAPAGRAIQWSTGGAQYGCWASDEHMSGGELQPLSSDFTAPRVEKLKPIPRL